MRYPIRFRIAASLAALAGAPLSAADHEPPAAYSRRDWHVKDGMPSDEVTQVLQDRRGYLWVATTGGLARFDGAQFSPRPLAGLGGRRAPSVRAMVESHVLGLVIAPAAGGAWVEQGDGFRAAPFAAAVGDRIVTALLAEADGTVWAGCADGAVIRHGAEGTQTFSVASTLPGGRRVGFAIDGAKRVWVAFGETLVRHDAGKLVPAGMDFGASTDHQAGGNQKRSHGSHDHLQCNMTSSIGSKTD